MLYVHIIHLLLTYNHDCTCMSANGLTAARTGVVGVVTGSGDMGLNTMSPSLLVSPALTSSMSAAYPAAVDMLHVVTRNRGVCVAFWSVTRVIHKLYFIMILWTSKLSNQNIRTQKPSL